MIKVNIIYQYLIYYNIYQRFEQPTSYMYFVGIYEYI